VTLNQVNEQYDVAYNLLIAEGFESNIGKNTFSKIKGDPGTSAYLTKRVVEGMPYIGFGLGAQNLADGAIYYNLGAASKRMDAYRKAISEGHFPVQDFYVLPEEEIMAKVIAVSFYFGQIDKIAFESKFGVTLEEKFLEEVAFLKNNDLMQDSGRFFALTKKGKDVLNGILPLFYSEKSKLNLISRRC
jgi:oxygen-independent coproporphyrinogen-3 oxidase